MPNDTEEPTTSASDTKTMSNGTSKPVTHGAAVTALGDPAVAEQKSVVVDTNDSKTESTEVDTREEENIEEVVPTPSKPVETKAPQEEVAEKVVIDSKPDNVAATKLVDVDGILEVS